MSVEPKPVAPVKVTNRTIYDASSTEVFFKNFLAGLGHGLGQILVYLIFVAIMFSLVVRFVWPMVEPYVQMYQRSMESIQKMQSWMPGSDASNTPSSVDQQGSNFVWGEQILQQIRTGELNFNSPEPNSQ